MIPPTVGVVARVAAQQAATTWRAGHRVDDAYKRVRRETGFAWRWTKRLLIALLIVVSVVRLVAGVISYYVTGPGDVPLVPFVSCEPSPGSARQVEVPIPDLPHLNPGQPNEPVPGVPFPSPPKSPWAAAAGWAGSVVHELSQAEPSPQQVREWMATGWSWLGFEAMWESFAAAARGDVAPPSAYEPWAQPPAPAPQPQVGTVGAVGSSSRYQALYQQAGQRYGVDPALLAAVAKTESGENPRAVSPAGAAGLMQFMPATSRSLGVDPFDPVQAVDGAARYLRDLQRQFRTVDLTLAAYNAGPGAVRRYGGIPPYRETQGYVRKVRAEMTASCPPVAAVPVKWQQVAHGLRPRARAVLAFGSRFPGVSDVGGKGSRGVASFHPSGQAVDFMVRNWRTVEGKRNGDRLAAALWANRHRLGVTEVIWRGRIITAARVSEGWRSYRHPSGSREATPAHSDHVHATVPEAAHVAIH